MDSLDHYLRKQASQDVRKKVAAVFGLTPDGTTVAGFYTLSAHLVNLSDLPIEHAKRLPRYPFVPATLLGRLAISTAFQGQRLGKFLLMHAFEKALESSRRVATAMVVVDAQDEAARSFYLRYGFVPLESQPNRLLYPMKTIEKLFGSSTGSTL